MHHFSEEQSKHWEGVVTRKMKAGGMFSPRQKNDCRRFKKILHCYASFPVWKVEGESISWSLLKRGRGCPLADFLYDFLFNDEIFIKMFQKQQENRKQQLKETIQDKGEGKGNAVIAFPPIYLRSFCFFFFPLPFLLYSHLGHTF